jgi:hypothetical protein
VERQALEQQSKDVMAQLHAAQLECQVLKNQGEIEGADTIRKKLVCMLHTASLHSRELYI